MSYLDTIVSAWLTEITESELHHLLSRRWANPVFIQVGSIQVPLPLPPAKDPNLLPLRLLAQTVKFSADDITIHAADTYPFQLFFSSILPTKRLPSARQVLLREYTPNHASLYHNLCFNKHNQCICSADFRVSEQRQGWFSSCLILCSLLIPAQSGLRCHIATLPVSNTGIDFYRSSLYRPPECILCSYTAASNWNK